VTSSRCHNVVKRLPISFAMAIAVTLLADAAFAQQTRPERPYRGLFGNGGSSDVEQSLTATGSFGAGYDTSVLAEAGEAGFGGGGSTPRPSEEGSYILFSEGLSYLLSKKKVGFTATQSAALRMYPTIEQDSIANYGGGIGASWSPSTRTHLSASQTLTHQPMNLFALFPVFQTNPIGQVYLADLDYGTVDAGYSTYYTGVSGSRRLSSRATFTADYSYERSDYALYPDYTSQMAGARFTRSLKAGLGLRIGYNYTRTLYGSGNRLAGRHGLDTGVDYNKTLSFSRRTTLSFSTGGSATKYQGDTHITAIGSANLIHEIGRTWQFNAGYKRDVGFEEAFSAPFSYDAATVALNGLIDRAWSFHSAAGAFIGALGFGSTASANGFNTYYANAGVSRALNRHISLGLDYSFYRYDYDKTATLLPRGYQNDFNRNAVRATLNAWLPLFERGRRSNAAR